jgi:hypothetical protein
MCGKARDLPQVKPKERERMEKEKEGEGGKRGNYWTVTPQ